MWVRYKLNSILPWKGAGTQGSRHGLQGHLTSGVDGLGVKANGSVDVQGQQPIHKLAKPGPQLLGRTVWDHPASQCHA